jgi:hypothetical protein
MAQVRPDTDEQPGLHMSATRAPQTSRQMIHEQLADVVWLLKGGQKGLAKAATTLSSYG